MKKLHHSWIAPVLALAIFLAPLQSRAVVSLFNPGYLVAGLVCLGLGAGVGGAGLIGFATTTSPAKADLYAEVLLGGVVGALLGVVLLDANQDIVFGPISAENGEKIGLTPEELAAYNDPTQLDTINLVKQQVQQGLEGIADPNLVLQKSHDLWLEYGTQNLTPAAFSALQKIAIALKR